MSFGLKLEGVDELIVGLEDRKDAVVQATKDALLVEGSAIEADSFEHCPVDNGPLRSNVRTDVEEGGRSVSIVYFMEYAAVQHERLDFKHAPGKEAKYLENAVDRALRGFADRVATYVNSVLG